MKKLALVVGINYEGTSSHLGGCINDAKEIAKALVSKFDFNLKDIQLLIEDFATKKNILDGLEYMISNLEAGDIGVFTYSGHGTQTADLPPIDEEDMLDEAIVPFDGIANQSNLIRDDEINEKLSQIKNNVQFTVIFDSCHSGTSTRFMESDKSVQARTIPLTNTATQIEQFVNDITNLSAVEVREVKGKTRHPLSGMNHILLAGCKSDQLSFDDGTNGFFTKALLGHLNKGVTYEELYNLVKEPVLKRSHNNQEPQLEGSLLNQKMFEISNP